MYIYHFVPFSGLPVLAIIVKFDASNGLVLLAEVCHSATDICQTRQLPAEFVEVWQNPAERLYVFDIAFREWT